MILKTEQSLKDLWDSNKGFNISVIRVLEGDKKEGSSEKVFEEIMTGHPSSLTKDKNLKVQKFPKQDKPKEIHTQTNHIHIA